MVVWARLGTAMPRIAGRQCKCAAGSNSALAALPQQGLVFAACQRENAVCAYRWQGEALAPLWLLPLEQASCVLPLAR